MNGCRQICFMGSMDYTKHTDDKQHSTFFRNS